MDSELDVAEMGRCGWNFMMIYSSLTLLNYCVSPITFVMFERKTERGFSSISSAISAQSIQTAAGARLRYTRVSTKGIPVSLFT
jgi:hypothetical protein